MKTVTQWRHLRLKLRCSSAPCTPRRFYLQVRHCRCRWWSWTDPVGKQLLQDFSKLDRCYEFVKRYFNMSCTRIGAETQYACRNAPWDWAGIVNGYTCRWISAILTRRAEREWRTVDVIVWRQQCSIVSRRHQRAWYVIKVLVSGYFKTRRYHEWQLIVHVYTATGEHHIGDVTCDAVWLDATGSLTLCSDADGDVISQGLVSLRARVQQVSGAGAACYREATRSS